MFVKGKPQTSCLNNFIELHLFWFILIFDWIKKFSFKTESMRKVQYDNEFDTKSFHFEIKTYSQLWKPYDSSEFSNLWLSFEHLPSSQKQPNTWSVQYWISEQLCSFEHFFASLLRFFDISNCILYIPSKALY